MEQKEEKKIKVQRRRRRRRQSKSTRFFPLDVISNILLKLPAKSLVRFGCVSKLWSSIIKDPYFINSFETLSSTRPSLLVCFEKRDTLCVFSTPQHPLNSKDSYSYSHHTYRRFLEYNPFSVSESVHGLICIQKSENQILLWNPSMRRFLTLRKPRTIKSWMDIEVFLGYDPIEGKHKVLCLPSNHKCWVLTLGSARKSWRTVENNHKHRSGSCSSGKCINGILYYLAYLKLSHDYVIMSFDVRSEKFHVIEKPSNIHRNVTISYEGRLAFVEQNNTNNGIRLLILEDAEKHEWSSKDFDAPIVLHDPSSGRISNLRGITPAGEFVYVADRYDQPFFTFFYDPEKNTFRKLEHERTEDNRFLELHVCPNHFESLRSL